MQKTQVVTSIKSGEQWLDTDGNLIQAHGGGILFDKGVYYWYGANMDIETIIIPDEVHDMARTDVIGVSCYSSTDLMNWKNEGIVLSAVVDDAEHDLHPSKVLERPKVVYNERTKQYVMWMHIDHADYSYSCAGVAISDHPTGPFQYLRSFRPHDAMLRDMTLFQDDDGKAYLYYSSENNSTLYISLLDEEYLQPAGPFTRNFIDKYREAPAVFKHKSKYYMISSGCTWWDPNEAEYAVADTPLGPWEVKGNPCIGKDADKTFYAQSTHVLPVNGSSNTFIFMADRWKEEDLGDSRYIWLPFTIEDNEVQIQWLDYWQL